YTYSMCTGTATPGSFPQIASGYTNPADPDMDKGHCDQDRTNLANATAGYQTPDFGNRVAHVLASNWRVTGIYTYRSGQWINITTGADNALNGQLQQRPNQVSENVYGSPAVHRHSPSPGSAAAAAEPGLGECLWTAGVRFAEQVVGDAQQLPESRGVCRTRAGDVRQPPISRHRRSRVLDDRRRLLAPHLARRNAQHRAAPGGVQPDESLQLGYPHHPCDVGRCDPYLESVRPAHDQRRRAADHAVRRQIRVLRSDVHSSGPRRNGDTES